MKKIILTFFLFIISNLIKAQEQPIFSGTYTTNGESYCHETGYRTPPSFIVEIRVEFYNDYIKVNSQTYPFKTIYNGMKIYDKVGTNGYYDYYTVGPNYEMSHTFFYGGLTITSPMTYVNPTNYITYPSYPSYSTPSSSYSSGSTYSSSSPSSSSRSSSNNSTSTRRTCSICKGTGRVEKDDGLSFGLDKKWCSECNKEVFTSHYHAPCQYCHGKGYVE